MVLKEFVICVWGDFLFVQAPFHHVELLREFFEVVWLRGMDVKGKRTDFKLSELLIKYLVVSLLSHFLFNQTQVETGGKCLNLIKADPSKQFSRSQTLKINYSHLTYMFTQC